MKIVWDIDGVLRNLYPVIRRKYKLWSPNKYHDWDAKGINIYDLVKKDYSLLEKAKPTKYVKILRKYYKKEVVELWSWQPEDWISHTCFWLDKYFPKYYARWLKPEEKYKLLQNKKDTILVEDNPHLKDYKRVWLINQKYNDKVKCDVRINTVEDLRRLLKENENGI